MTDKVVNTVQPTAADAVSPQTTPTFGINDLVAVRDIAKAAIERNTFQKVEELSFVMDIYKKLNEFAEFAVNSIKKAESEVENLVDPAAPAEPVAPVVAPTPVVSETAVKAKKKK